MNEYKSANMKMIHQNQLKVNVRAFLYRKPTHVSPPLVFVYRADLPHPIWRMHHVVRQGANTVNAASTYICPHNICIYVNTKSQ